MKGLYVLVEDEEIEAVKLESKKTLELTQFVDADEIDVLYFEKPYYVVPADDLAKRPISCCARRCGARARLRSGSWRCGAANMW
jgi:hypothetical protein